jgi:hypothetical protein
MNSKLDLDKMLTELCAIKKRREKDGSSDFIEFWVPANKEGRKTIRNLFRLARAFERKSTAHQ